MMKKPGSIGPKRRLFQWFSTVLILAIPWVEIDGNSLLRIDIPDLTLYLFGQVLRIQELYLVLLLTLILILGFLLVTVVLGRVWCGWLCPQTTVSDVAEWAARRLGLSVRQYRIQGSAHSRALLHGVYLLLSFLVAANLLWYFIPPPLFFSKLFSLDLHYSAWITLAATLGLTYFNLAFVRRLMCRDFCPYGRFQTVLIDRSTLTLNLPDTELERCIECESCVRTCPMEIDIRHGYQVECTNCGRCLDACRKIMTKRGEPGLIRYTFGLHNEGAGGLLNPRVLLPAVIMAVLFVILTVSIIDRPTASLKVAVSRTAQSRQLQGGMKGTFFNAWVNNRSQNRAEYALSARTKGSDRQLDLKGQVRAHLAAGSNKRLDFVLVTPEGEQLTVEFVLKDEKGKELAVAEAIIEN